MSSLFGNAQTGQQQSGSVFGGFGSTQPQQQSGGIFGNQNSQQNQQPQQQQNTLFGQTTQQSQQPQQNSLFGGLGQNNQGQQPQQSSLFSGLGQSTLGQQPQQQQQQQQQQGGGLFGNQTQQQSSGLFGQSAQNQAPQQSTLFGQSNNQNQNQNQQNGGAFGLTTNNQQSQFGASQLWQPEVPHQKSVAEQLQEIVGKWHKDSPDCAFQYYFYNKVDERSAPFYGPAPNEDPKAWDVALSKKPGPGYIPVLCRGFEQMGERIKTQQRNLATFNQKLHEINSSLDAMLSKHDLVISVRAVNARRRHAVLKQRCLAIATKVQVLRNRGYVMGGDEEELKAKLLRLERGVCDPGLSARAEEIWARMVGIRERAKVLRDESGKALGDTGAPLDEIGVRRAEKILEDYARQLDHMKSQLKVLSEEFEQWEKEQVSPAKKR